MFCDVVYFKLCVVIDKMNAYILVVLSVSVFIYGQSNPPFSTTGAPDIVPTNVDRKVSEKIGNFSLELLYHTSKESKNINLLLSPVNVWTVLAVFYEGAVGETASQIGTLIRLSRKYQNITRHGFNEIYQWLQVNTNTVEVAKVNAIFLDEQSLLQNDFQELADDVYKTKILALDFSDKQKAANAINKDITWSTRGQITHVVDGDDLDETSLLVISSLYFKGQWTFPFSRTLTVRMPFLDNNGQEIGEVNMMYNRYNYQVANIKELQARVIEIPYGIGNQLSMLIVLPNPGVSLENMFLNFLKVHLHTVFEELQLSKQRFSEEQVDLFLPRFKIESDLDLSYVFLNRMGIHDLFQKEKARLPHMSRTPTYVKKIIHKVQITVIEDGTTASRVTADDRHIRIVHFVADRPFFYMIVEKVTNSIVLGGFYDKPFLY